MRSGGLYERVLHYFDEDGDGKISPRELSRRLGLMGGEMLLKEAEIGVESLDLDGDGLLGLEDVIGLMESGEKEEKLEELREAFGMYDEDGCGYITAKGLKRMLGKLGESRSIDECMVMIDRFDLNGDGVICFEEFRVMME
ncbi:hypothetical protein SLA2020_251540 [Shorea laevis]